MLNRRASGLITGMLPVLLALLFPAPAMAHVSEQGLVLLLPTGHYITSGVLSVVASIILISLTPKHIVQGLFKPGTRHLPQVPANVCDAVSLLSFLALAIIIYVGATGPRDPLTNLLPLTIWIGFWVMLVSLAGLLGNFWRCLNPWSGLYRLLIGSEQQGLLPLPERFGAVPGLLLFIAFSAFYIVDPAPQDPDRLAGFVITYWALTFACMVIFGGPVWLARGEAFSILFDLISRVSPFGNGPRAVPGFPGWALVPSTPLPLSLATFSLVVLAMGSFDGLKETFWWLARIGVNPLEFPGRSAVVGTSLLGLLLATIALFAVLLLAVWAGQKMANLSTQQTEQLSLELLFRSFAPTVLPIALGYHISHFMISFLVDGQYLLAVLGDPLATGANLFGLADIRVTTGFLNTPDSVKVIWLTQATIVVIGHILSVLMSHAVAMKLFATARRAALSQIPIGVFMVLYTLFGLWLLAAPRGA